MHTHMRNPDPPLRTPPLFHTHATTHPLASMCSPTLHQHTRFPGSEHKRKQNIRFEGNKTIASVCVCKNALERERERGVYTHTHWSKEYGEVIFSFFLLLQSVTIKSCHIPMTSFFFFWWRKHIMFSYSHQTNNTTSNFLNVFFFIACTYSLHKTK